MKLNKILAAGAVVAFASAALAAVTFDPATGTGFVGKGDVQLAFGWNNHQLQANLGNVSFSATATTVSEVSWICTNERNENTQERARTTTATTQGVLSSIERVKNQITGYKLTGYASTGATTTTSTEGPQLNSCPAMPSTWSLTTPAGDPQVISSTSVLSATWTTAVPAPVTVELQ